MANPTQPSLPDLRHNRWLAPLLVLCIALGLTVLAWRHQLAEDSQERSANFSIQSALITVELRDRLRHHAQFLRDLRGFIASRSTPDQAAWQHYVRWIELPPQGHGIHAFGYAPLQSAATAHAEGGETGRLPVTLLAPDTPLNRRSLGFDLLSEAVRADTVALARDSGEVALTGRIRLSMESDPEQAQPGFLMLLPLYRGAATPASVSERRKAFAGVVFIAYRMQDFVQTLNYARSSLVGLQVFDQAGYDSDRGGELLTLFFESEPGLSGQPPNEEREMDFGQRAWLLRFHDRSSLSEGGFRETRLILAGGVLISLLLGALVMVLTSQRQHAEALARRRNRELVLSEERFQLATGSTGDGLWDLDLVQGQLYCSPRLLTMLGRAPDAGRLPLSEIELRVHPDDRAGRRQAFVAHIRERRPYDVQYRLDQGGGRWHWYRARGQAVWNAQGRAVRMVGWLSDITVSKALEAENQRHREKLHLLVEERTAHLQRAIAVAEAANRVKSEFLANMSHELRTPMHAILSFAILGCEKASHVEPGRLQQYFERIRQSALRLLDLVNDLLDLAKLEAGKMAIQLRRENVAELIEAVVAELEPLLTARNLRLEFDQGMQPLFLSVDAQRFAQVMNNILSNAIKFSYPEACIRIRTTASELLLPDGNGTLVHLPALAIAVSDQGVGIPEGELESIFDKFTQSSLTRTGAGGTGLGLAICREIMHAHRGTIVAHNNPQGGATFVLTFPCGAAPEDPPRMEKD
ncbi:MAG: hypothetical protein RIR00_2536 [Pseudomonadota bacterium]|jgi:signal transduction histidine kinase